MVLLQNVMMAERQGRLVKTWYRSQCSFWAVGLRYLGWAGCHSSARWAATQVRLSCEQQVQA